MKTYFAAILFLLTALPAAAQVKVGFFDSNSVMEKLPEVKDVQNQLDVMTEDWKKEIQQMKKELDDRFKEFRTQSLLYSDDVRRKREDEIIALEQKIADYQNKKFGVNGELFTKQSELMKPIQNSIFKAAKVVAEEEKIDFIFDRSGQISIFYANPALDLTEKILKRVRATGIDKN
ncbi:MAG: OmpH family outer membrane protein [Bacteroidetes bacterium]|nr:OmpH family outer membrane protein [Bacteroidota bacterium]